MSRDEAKHLPLWLPVISVKADDAVGIFTGMQISVQRNKRLGRAADYLLHVSVSSVGAATTSEAAQLGGKVIGLVYFISSEPENNQERGHIWLAQQPLRFNNPFPWKGAPGTFRVPLTVLGERLSGPEMIILQSRLKASQP